MTKPIDAFEAALDRAKHSLILYDLVHDTRNRSIRSDWATSFKRIMHWPASESIVRVDGKGADSILILRESLGIDRSRFTHDYTSELLRAAIVASVSAVDRYFHDIVVYHCWGLISRPEDQIPKQLLKISIPILAAKKAVEKGRSNNKSRPGHIVKKAIQEQLHRTFTFQNPDDIVKAAQMLAITDFWGRIANEMPDSQSKDAIIQRLKEIGRRRNQIVHEADLILKTKAKQLTLREVSPKYARDTVDWISSFGHAADKVIGSAV